MIRSIGFTMKLALVISFTLAATGCGFHHVPRHARAARIDQNRSDTREYVIRREVHER